MDKENELLERLIGALKEEDDTETIKRVLIAMLYSTCAVDGHGGFIMETSSGLILEFKSSEVINEKFI
ncbi:MAG: hypothetical protein ACRCX2_14535 [Paraclostridium sp.]